MKRARFLLRLITAFWQKHKRWILASTIIGVLSFFYFPKAARFLFSNNTQKIGLVGKFTSVELPLEIQELISKGLTSILPDGQATPSLASSWEISKKGREYIFTLKEDIYWQSGEPVLAQDINYNFNDVALKIVDKKKVKFELKEPFSPFPTVVSRPIFKKGFLGTGEYKVKSIRRNGQIIEKLVLVPFKDKSKPKLVFRFYPTESAARIAFKLGEVDILREISNAGELRSWKKVETAPTVKFNQFVGIFFNTQSKKLSNKFLRQALAYAIKNRWQPRALNSINPHSWAYNPNVKPYNFDLDNAKKLLKKSAEGEETQPLEKIELSTVPSLLPTAEAIKKDWEQLGIEVKIKIINSLGESFEALLIAQEIPPDPDQYTLWHSTQVSNISRYKSPKLDKLLEDGRKTLDQEKRKEIYHDFQRFLVEDTPVIFLYHPTLYTISRK